MRRRAFGLLPVACLALFAAEPHWRQLRSAANAAIRVNDFAKLHEMLLELKPLMPGNARNAYNLAASSARLGNTSIALEELQQWAGMGLIADVAGDPDFAGLRSLAPFVTVQREIEKNKLPVSHSRPEFQITERDLIPEDIAWDSRTRRYFISSVRQAKIITSDGKEFAGTPWSAFALRADVRHRILWASTAWTPHCAKCSATDKDKTALLAFNLDTGELRQRIDSPVPGSLGDMTVSTRGDVFITESTYGAVFRLKQGASEFERLDVPGEFLSPQTPALSQDERTLYIPDYVRGIAAMNVQTREVIWLQPAGDIALSGIDGLYVYGKGFIAVQNGTNPVRVIRFSGDLKSQQILEANTPGLGEPTHGTIVGNTFYFLANGGWDEYDEQGRKKAGSGPVVSNVRSIRLR